MSSEHITSLLCLSNSILISGAVSSCVVPIMRILRMKVATAQSLMVGRGKIAHKSGLAAQVVQVCAEHKKPRKLQKHLEQVKVRIKML